MPTRGQEVGDRAVETVALGVGIGGDRRRQLTDPLRQIRQQARQLAALRAERGAQRRLVGASHELIERLDERPVRAPHHRVTRAVEHQRAGAGGLVRELADQPALARAGFAADQREPRSLSPSARGISARSVASSRERPANGNDGVRRSGPGSPRHVRGVCGLDSQT